MRLHKIPIQAMVAQATAKYSLGLHVLTLESAQRYAEKEHLIITTSSAMMETTSMEMDVTVNARWKRAFNVQVAVPRPTILAKNYAEMA